MYKKLIFILLSTFIIGSIKTWAQLGDFSYSAKVLIIPDAHYAFDRFAEYAKNKDYYLIKSERKEFNNRLVHKSKCIITTYSARNSHGWYRINSGSYIRKGPGLDYSVIETTKVWITNNDYSELYYPCRSYVCGFDGIQHWYRVKPKNGKIGYVHPGNINEWQAEGTIGDYREARCPFGNEAQRALVRNYLLRIEDVPVK